MVNEPPSLTVNSAAAAVDQLTDRRRRQRQAVLDVLARPKAVHASFKLTPPHFSFKAMLKKNSARPNRSRPRRLTPWPPAKPIIKPAAGAVVKPVAPATAANLSKIRPSLVSPYRSVRRAPAVIIATLCLIAGSSWLAIYKFGAHGWLVQQVAELLPLPAGQVNQQVILLRDLWRHRAVNNHFIAEAKVSTALLPLDDQAVFLDLIDKQLIRQALQARAAGVDDSVVDGQLQQLARGFSAADKFNDWIYQTYGLNLADWRHTVLRPDLERQRLAVILISNQNLYAKYWAAAQQLAAQSGTSGLADSGWVTAADLPDGLPDIVAGLVPNIRTQPFVTSDGLMVLAVSERLFDEAGAPHWHLWQKLIPVPALNDFLTAARQTADIKYYLP